MSDELQGYPFRVRWWESGCNYSAVRDKVGWSTFYEKEDGDVRWYEIQATPQLIARAEAITRAKVSSAEGKHVKESSAIQEDSPFHEIQFYSCFISYSTNDRAFAERLYSDLKSKGVGCWFAPHDAKSGVKLGEQIEEAIRLYDRLLLILSESSMNSEWVKVEIRKARQREVVEGKQVLFPILLVSFEALQDWVCLDFDGKNLAEEIREYFIPDFSNWKDHDSYQTAFQRLVKDLKAKASK
jgi:hypothetical protein